MTRKRKSIGAVLVFVTVFLLVGAASVGARWRPHAGWGSFEEITCWNGILIGFKTSDNYGGVVDWYDGAKAYQADTPIIGAQVKELTILEAEHGPKEDDLPGKISPAQFFTHFWKIRWKEYVASQYYYIRLFNKTEDIHTPQSLVKPCSIGDEVDQVPSQYVVGNDNHQDGDTQKEITGAQVCGEASSSPRIYFPADLEIYDVDVALYISGVSSGYGVPGVNASLTSAEGTRITLLENQLSSNHKFGSTCQGQYDEDNIPDYFPDLVFDNHAEDYVYSNTFFDGTVRHYRNYDLTELEGESTSREKNDYWQLDVTNGDLECWCLSVKGYRAARFPQDEIVVDEGAGKVKVAVELSEKSKKASEFDYEILPSEGSNQSGLGGSVKFAAGKDKAKIIVPIVDDKTIESGESITLKLPDFAASPYGYPGAETVIRIRDNDAGRIEGTVTDDWGGQPLGDIGVGLYEFDGYSWYLNREVFTDWDGSYAIEGLGSGTYRVDFYDYYGVYRWEFFDNAANASCASDITVKAGKTASGTDAGMYSYYDNPNAVLVSSSSNGVIEGIRFMDEDILKHNPTSDTWSMYFDGSDVGLKGGADIDALHLMDDGSFLFSLLGPYNVPGLGKVDDSDIIRFVPSCTGVNTSGTFELYFDGSDVGLTTSGEDVDALALAPDGRLLISTSSRTQVDGIAERIEDEDIIAFTPTQLGDNTAGSWAFYFDGSDVGLSSGSEDVAGLWLDPTTGSLNLVPQSSFKTDTLKGKKSTALTCTPLSLGTDTSCSLSVFWNGGDYGFGRKLTNAFSRTDNAPVLPAPPPGAPGSGRPGAAATGE